MIWSLKWTNNDHISLKVPQPHGDQKKLWDTSSLSGGVLGIFSGKVGSPVSCDWDDLSHNSHTCFTSLLPQEHPSGTLLCAHKLLVGVIINYDWQFTHLVNVKLYIITSCQNRFLGYNRYSNHWLIDCSVILRFLEHLHWWYIFLICISLFLAVPHSTLWWADLLMKERVMCAIVFSPIWNHKENGRLPTFITITLIT